MEELLFLAHRIPYPPDKGDKIRSFHLLRHLAGRYRVHLGAFVDDPQDWQHESAVREMCQDVCLIPLNPTVARIWSLRGFLQGLPLSLTYFKHRRLDRWVTSLLERGAVCRVFVYSSSMAQYLIDRSSKDHLHSVLDLVDVDSEKWLQYGASKRWPASVVFDREGRTLRRFEARAAAAFDSSVFVSEAEADLFRRLVPQAADRTTFIENGVDSDFFSPDGEYQDPYSGNREVLVFTGAMDYWANVDAVRWFALDAFPEIRRRRPEAQFYIVGARPTREVVALGRPDKGIVVTGRVPDVRPFLAHARCAVAPLRIARGIQNKVLEAFAMAKPVIASPQALEGLVFETTYPLMASSHDDWIRMAAGPIRTGIGKDLGACMRDWVVMRYSWQSRLDRLVQLLEQ